MSEIYFDNAATTRVLPEVAQVVLNIMTEEYANPSSLHEKGFRASQAKEKARGEISAVLGCEPRELFFTSGGTEANNLAVLGGARAHNRRGKTIITTQIEHASILGMIPQLEKEGFRVIGIKPESDGGLNLELLEKAVSDDTILVSIGMVNSELGTIAPIKKAAEAIKAKHPDILFHSDAVQAFGKIPFSVGRLGVDLLTISGHKLGAPKGVGALYIKKGARILPTSYGGGQEEGIRSGTENLPGICGFGVAATAASRNLNENLAKVGGLCKYFMNKVEKSLGLRINSTGEGAPYICSVSVPGYRSETILHYMADHGIYISSGSACAKGAKSHVLSAINLSNQRIDSALRISFSPANTTEEIDYFFKVLKQAREDLIRS